MDKWLNSIKIQNNWKLNRIIIKNNNSIIIKGEITWTYIDKNIYRYTETVKFNDKSFNKSYIYDFNQKNGF